MLEARRQARLSGLSGRGQVVVPLEDDGGSNVVPGGAFKVQPCKMVTMEIVGTEACVWC